MKKGKPILSHRPASGDHAFTRLELLAVLACLVFLALVQLPSLGKSREGSHEAVCMNNMRQLGVALLMYTEVNHDFVPEEGNIANTIFNAANSDAWYNLGVQGYFPSMASLYLSNNIPLPGTGSIYSCPSASPPLFSPSFGTNFFMYGMNNWICVNKSSRAAGLTQTILSTIPKPRDTVFLTEVDDTAMALPAISGATPPYAPSRHLGNGFFTMTDGHVRSARTNEYQHAAGSATVEWSTLQTMYWWPTPTTPQ